MMTDNNLLMITICFDCTFQKCNSLLMRLIESVSSKQSAIVSNPVKVRDILLCNKSVLNRNNRP